LRQSLKIVLIFELLLIPFLILTIPNVNASEGSTPVKNSQGIYQFRIETSQWEIKAYDMVVAESMMAELGVTDLEEGFNEGKFGSIEQKHRVGKFEKSGIIEFFVYSRDVQHGFSINEIDVAIATIRPEPGQTFGAATRSGEITLPNEDVTMSAFCHIFCGLGHPDMKIKFLIGQGSDEYGPQLFYSVIVLNVLIFAFVVNKIWNKVE
jgi:hypothetical protein